MASRMSDYGTMKAAVIYEAGGPEAFNVEERPIPKPVRDCQYSSNGNDCANFL